MNTLCEKKYIKVAFYTMGLASKKGAQKVKKKKKKKTKGVTGATLVVVILYTKVKTMLHTLYTRLERNGLSFRVVILHIREKVLTACYNTHLPYSFFLFFFFFSLSYAKHFGAANAFILIF